MWVIGVTLKYLTLSKEFEDVADVAYDKAGVEGGDERGDGTANNAEGCAA